MFLEGVTWNGIQPYPKCSGRKQNIQNVGYKVEGDDQKPRGTDWRVPKEYWRRSFSVKIISEIWVRWIEEQDLTLV